MKPDEWQQWCFTSGLTCPFIESDLQAPGSPGKGKSEFRVYNLTAPIFDKCLQFNFVLCFFAGKFWVCQQNCMNCQGAQEQYCLSSILGVGPVECWVGIQAMLEAVSLWIQESNHRYVLSPFLLKSSDYSVLQHSTDMRRATGYISWSTCSSSSEQSPALTAPLLTSTEAMGIFSFFFSFTFPLVWSFIITPVSDVKLLNPKN